MPIFQNSSFIEKKRVLKISKIPIVKWKTRPNSLKLKVLPLSAVELAKLATSRKSSSFPTWAEAHDGRQRERRGDKV